MSDSDADLGAPHGAFHERSSGNRVTLVTGFVDLARLEPRPGRTWAIYLERARFLLEQPVPLVVFAEPDRASELLALRPAGAPTHFHPTTVEELVALSDRERIQACIRRSAIPWNPHKDTALYFALLRQKTEWLRQATQLDPFRTEHFGWIDLALPKIDGLEAAMKDGIRRIAQGPCSERIRFCSLSYVAESAFASRATFYAQHYWPLAGGLFVGPKDALRWLADEFGREWQAALAEGLAASDEMIFGFIAHAHPERFELYYGDHPTILANYVDAKFSHPLIFAMVARSRADGDHSKSRLRLEAIRSHIDEKNPSIWADFWDEWYIAHYYLDRHVECRRALDAMVAGALGDSERLAALRARSQRLVSNAAFVQEPARQALDLARRAPEPSVIDASLRAHGFHGRVDVIVEDDFHPLMLSIDDVRYVRRDAFRAEDYERVLGPVGALGSSATAAGATRRERAMAVTGYVANAFPAKHLSDEQFRALGGRLKHALAGKIHAFDDHWRLEDCWAWSLLKENPALMPSDVNPPSDRFHEPQHAAISNIVLLQRYDWMRRAGELYPDVDVFAWIEYSVLKQRNVNEGVLQQFMQTLEEKSFDAVSLPGVHEKGPIDDSRAHWRFCGSCWVCPRKYLGKVFEAVRTVATLRARMTGKISWDMNTMAYVELLDVLPIRWYAASHDETQFANF